ncbi:transglutaminase-like domain-containing protein [Streptomyces fuscichromogenes]|uniref:transglutaminase-like domain-containing protein n=1 Tax=Streptomyces fuscichromogenes TaxID=1324013 RepID=UPI0027E5A230|nr:transglutaminase-like domain-containing protein [Streptomyces fuscichromogenes]
MRRVIPQDRLHNDAETRYTDGILEIITERNDAPLAQRREAGDRFVGVCRDFALLHCSFLRHAGIPARLRSGFADHLGSDGFHAGHVVTRYWDTERGWLFADPQLANPAVTDARKADFDPMDVPRGRFLAAGNAGQAIRTGEADPKTFGLHSPEEGPMGAGAGGNTLMTDAVRELYDRASLVVCDGVPLDAAQKPSAENEGLRTPRTVLSPAPSNGSSEVTLR